MIFKGITFGFIVVVLFVLNVLVEDPENYDYGEFFFCVVNITVCVIAAIKIMEWLSQI